MIANNKQTVGLPKCLSQAPNCQAVISTKRIAHSTGCAPELVLIHGWGFDSTIWSQSLETLTQYFSVTLIDLPGYGNSQLQKNSYQLNILLNNILDVVPNRAVFCGWSFGANVILQLASVAPERVLGIISIASNPCFLTQDNWPGVSFSTYQKFSKQLEKYGETFLQRFASLCVKGVVDEKYYIDKIKQYAMSNKVSQTALHASLALTVALDSRALLARLSMPQLYILSEDDLLSHSELVDKLQKNINQYSHVVHIEKAPHAVFLTHKRLVWDHMLHFCQQYGLVKHLSAFDKGAVGKSFDNAALTYDNVAQLQQSVALRLSQMIDDSQCYMTMLDIGCGTGFSFPLLKKRRGDKILGIDLSSAMLRKARKKHQECNLLQSDFDLIPLRDDSVDLLHSSLALQWSQQLTTTLSECRRILKPYANMVFSTLLSGTLRELKTAWFQVDPNHVHVNSFLDEQELRRQINNAGMTLVNIERETIRRQYVDVFALMRELKQLGAHNVNQGRMKGLAGKKLFNKLQDAYQVYRSKDGVYASYEVAYIVLQKA